MKRVYGWHESLRTQFTELLREGGDLPDLREEGDAQ